MFSFIKANPTARQINYINQLTTWTQNLLVLIDKYTFLYLNQTKFNFALKF